MKKIITILCAHLMSFCAMAESYVYLTNNTDQPLQLRIEQSGSSLIKGEHWWQLADSVPPYGTVRFLETNRDSGIKWGKTYYYDTYVTAPDGSEVILQQKLKGTWDFSDIWHGVKQSPWYDDRGLYSEHQSFAGKNSTVAFRAEYARVNGDDIYYVIHPDTVYPQQGPSNELNVLAYNVWALLPGLVSKDVTDRLTEISKQLEGFDVVVFSELFENSRREDFLDRIRAQLPYQTHVVDRSGSVEDGGVLIVSRWPIEHEAQTTFSSCDADDCMAAKGVMYARIDKNGQKYHVFGSHTQAWTAPENQATRAHQFAEMKSFIDQQGIAAEEPVVIAGDLNVDKAHFPSEYQAMLSTLNASEVAQTADSYTYTADGNVNAWTDGRPEFLDYVLTSNAHLQPVNGTSKVRVPRSIAASVFTDYDLSDHFAMEASLTFDVPAIENDNGMLNLNNIIAGTSYDFYMKAVTNGCELQWQGGNTGSGERNAKFDCGAKGDQMLFVAYSSAVTAADGSVSVHGVIKTMADGYLCGLEWDGSESGGERNAKFDCSGSADPLTITSRSAGSSERIIIRSDNDCGLEWDGSLDGNNERNAKFDCEPRFDEFTFYGSSKAGN